MPKRRVPDVPETNDPRLADSPDAKLLIHIRDRYSYFIDAWKQPREERRTDLRYICGDPWSDEDKIARRDAGRPCINHDELGQYVNACVNERRQNKRGIKVSPAGNGASDKSAELNQGIIRRIEYRSTAPSIYNDAYQAMVEGSYSFFRVARRYVSDDSFDQEIVLKPIPNPDSVLYDPDTKEPDWSDATDCFVLDPIPLDEFKRRWPEARKTDFSSEDRRVAKDWLQSKLILVAEYWRIETHPEKLYQLSDGSAVTQLPEGVQPLKTRTVERKTLVQYMTNGVEILERNPAPGVLLPIIPMVGLVRYVDESSGPKRLLFSLPRLARDPQMSLAYLNSQEMEEAGLSPKTPFLGYKGQFETDAEAWETVTKIPHAYLQVDPIIDTATQQVLPLPQRQQFTPNFAQYETAKESARRAVQAAMGISPLPTSAQRQNEKSGVALQRIQAQQQVGSYHFVAGFNRALAFAGRVIESWIPVVYDTEREIALGKPDDTHEVVTINSPEPYPNQETGEMQHFPIEDVEHDVTISDAPSDDSQREAASEFLDLLVSNLKSIPPPGTPQAKLLGLAIRMKQLGPMGDEMADIIAPPDNQQLPPQAQAQLNQAHAMVQQLTAALQKQTMKLEAKLPELAMKERVALIQARAGTVEALIKASSAEAIRAFELELEQIDRQLALLPDPGLETGAATQASGAQPAAQPAEQPAQPAVAA